MMHSTSHMGLICSFDKQIKILHLIELGPRSCSRRTTWWCDLRTEGVLLNELESEPAASTAIKSLACVHTPRWSLLKTASGGPTEPLSPTTSVYLCIWEPCCHTRSSNFLSDQKAKSHKLIKPSFWGASTTHSIPRSTPAILLVFY